MGEQDIRARGTFAGSGGTEIRPSQHLPFRMLYKNPLGLETWLGNDPKLIFTYLLTLQI